jgi:hypothetical protein
MMKKRNLLSSTLLATALFTGAFLASGSALACDAMGPSKHMGELVSVDPDKQTFTIRDAQSRSPITFDATQEIITGLKGFAGSLMVNYEENDAGGLNAVGVTF